MTCGDFHNGSEKGTASVHQILCQYWEKCYGEPHNDSTSLWGPKLELCAGFWMACLIQDRLHISWLWQTHRETHKLHNSWKCCMNSRARPSGLTLDHSWHCWGGGNWLWDTPMGSDGRTGHAPCCSQICAHDPGSWPEAAACQRLHGNELNWKTKWLSSPTHSTPLIWHPVTSSCFQKWNWSWKAAGLIPLRRYRPKHRECLIEKDFQEVFQKWRRRWDRCLHAGGNYSEGDGSQ